MSSLANPINVRWRGLFAPLTIGVCTGLIACWIGTPWIALPFIALFFPLARLALDADATQSGKHPLARAASGALATLVVRARTLPKAIQLLVTTFFVISLFALEMKIDIVPNQYGFLELLLPVFLSTILFEMSGGLFAAAITAFFAYDVFVPPRFSPIFQPGPEFSSLVAYTVVSVVVVLFTGFLNARTHRHELPPAEWNSLFSRNIAASRSSVIDKTRVWIARRDVVLPALLVCLYAFFWTIYATISSENGPHIDSLEAYSWGREFRPGYFKHPPFWSWVAGVWFLIFPKTPFWFYLLAELNSALGLLGAWALLGRFCKGSTRQLALILLLLTPFYQFNALRFNANTIFLSIWPWTMYFFVRTVETQRLSAAIMGGLLAGVALLSKYFAIVLIASCFIGALTHDNRRAYFLSAAPYVSILVAGAVFAPHVIWLFKDGFQPLVYLAAKGLFSEAEIANSYFTFIAANILYFVVPVVVVCCARFLPLAGLLLAPKTTVQNGPSFMTVLALAPFVLTLVAGVIGHTALAIPFGTPIFALVPLVLVLVVKPDERLALLWGKYAVGLVMAGCALSAPFYAYVSLRWGPARVAEPRREVAEVAERLWTRETGAPLRYVSGGEGYALATTFYASGNVSELRAFKFRWSPWVTPEALREHGLLAICDSTDQACLSAAEPFRTPETKRLEISVARKMWNFEAPSRPITLLIVPPRKG